MEEKDVLKNIRTKTKKSLIVLLILFVLAYIGFVSFFLYSTEYYQHIIQGDHYYDCYNEKGQTILSENFDYEHKLLENIEGVDSSNCECNKFSNIFHYFIHWLSTDFELLIFFIIISSIFLLTISVSIYCIYLTKCKFSVTENNIYGKKGHKKFDISFNDIIEIRKIGKGIIIKAENKELKLSPLKKCEEIYNYIKSFVPESTTEQQSTSTVDGIKLF